MSDPDQPCGTGESLDLEVFKARARELRAEGGGYSHNEASQLEYLVAEIERLRRASVSPPEPKLQQFIAELREAAAMKLPMGYEPTDQGYRAALRDTAERLAGLFPSPGTQKP